MIDVCGKKQLMTSHDLSAFTNITMYCEIDFEAPSVSSVTLFSFEMATIPERYILLLDTDSTLALYAPAPSGTGVWKWPITPGVHRIGIRYILDTSITNTPACYIDGMPQAPSSAVPPTAQYCQPLRRLFIAGSTLFSGPPLSIGEIALCGQLHTDAVMARYTNPATPKGSLRFAPGITNYWPCDELPDGQTNIQEIYSYPSGDVNTLWTNKSLATYWESVRNDDTNCIEALEADANEDQRLMFSSAGFVKPAGTEVIAIGANIKSAAPDEQQPFTVSVKKGATWYALPYTVDFAGWFITAKELVFTRYFGLGDWTQAELNGIQVGFLTGSMTAKDAKVTINHVYVTAYCGVWNRQLRDYISGNHLVNRDAQGRPERLLSYL